jgi:glycerophosphoryl diester phosphodiesterase
MASAAKPSRAAGAILRLLAMTAAALCLAALPAHAFDLEGHRGARGHRPENTLPAFAWALSTGVDTLELDTGITKDGVVVISHNRRLSPDITKGPDGAYLTGPGPAIHDLTFAELRRYDVGGIRPGTDYAHQFPDQQPVPGTSFPTLDEIARLVEKAGNAHVRFNIETKLSPLAPGETVDPETFAARLVEVVRKSGIAGRTMIQSFDWRTLKVVQKIAPEIPTVCLTFERGADDTIQRGKPGASPWTAGLDVDEFTGSVPRLVKAAGCAVWSPFFRDVSDAALTEAKSLGLQTVVWTVDAPADMDALIVRGVDGIITDYPDRLRDAMARHGLALPVPTPVAP